MSIIIIFCIKIIKKCQPMINSNVCINFPWCPVIKHTALTQNLPSVHVFLVQMVNITQVVTSKELSEVYVLKAQLLSKWFRMDVDSWRRFMLLRNWWEICLRRLVDFVDSLLKSFRKMMYFCFYIGRSSCSSR